MTGTNRDRIRNGIFNCPNCGAAAAPDSVMCRYCHSGLATRVCPACFGAIRIGMNHCPSCGTEAGDNCPAAAEELRCPRCRTSLARVGLGRRELAECLGCGGLWVDRATLEAITTDNEEQEAVLGLTPRRPAAAERQSGARAYVPCPVCARLMNRSNYAGCSGVVIDWCREHGSWFDHSELHRIVMFIREGGLRKSRERQREQLRLETERLRLREMELARLTRVSASSNAELEVDAGSLLGAFRDIWRGLG